MVRGLYTAYTGMRNEQKRLDVISNNMANAATAGYKEESTTSQAFDNVLAIKVRDGSKGYINEAIGTLNPGVKLGEVFTKYDQGSFRTTGNTYDLAISGKGFFTVKFVDSNGEASMKYTRDGTFKVTKDGFITDSNGNKVQGKGGDIQVPVDAKTVTIGKDGTILADGAVVDQLAIADFADYDYIKKYGENLFEVVDGATIIDAEGTVEQGFIEQSNVNSVSEMVKMITVNRAYEANSKVVEAESSMLDKAVNQVGKV